MSDGLPAVEDMSGSEGEDHDYGTGSELNSLASSSSGGSLSGPAPSHDEPLAPAPDPLTSDNLGDLTAQFAGMTIASGGSQVPSLGTSVYSMGLVIPDAPSVSSGEYAQPAPPPVPPQDTYPFPEGEIYSEEYFREDEYRSGRFWWISDPKICPHLRLYGTCGDRDGDVPPDAFKSFGSEVCLRMWSRHRPSHAYEMVVVDGRQSYQKQWWIRIGMEAKKYKPKRVCPLVHCGPCDLFRAKRDRFIRRCIEDGQVDPEYWDHHRCYIHGTPLLQDLQKGFLPEDSEKAGKLCWLRFPYEVREIIYDLLLVNRHRFTQREQNIQIADDQGPHHLVCNPKHLRVELGNTPWEWPCVDGRFDDVEHSPCIEGMHYPCTGIWPAILRTSKTVLAEASWILYSRNTFEVSLSLEASGDPWYNLYGKRNERRKAGKKSLGQIINRLYSYPEPEPLIMPPSHMLDDAASNAPSDGEPVSEYGLSEGSETDSENLSQASSEEQDYRVDRDPHQMPSWLSRIRLAAFLRMIGGRNASQIRTVYVTAFETDHVHLMLPIVTALFRQHMSRLTMVHFQLFRSPHGEETDASTSDASDGNDAQLTESWVRMYTQLAWMVRRVSSLKKLRYHGHYEFGSDPNPQQIGWLIGELDEILMDRRHEVERMPQLEVHKWFLRRMMAHYRQGRRIGPGWDWYVGRRWVKWVDAQRPEELEVLRAQLCLPYLTAEQREVMTSSGEVGVGGSVVEECGSADGEEEEDKDGAEVDVVEVGGTQEVAAAGPGEGQEA